MSRSDPFNPSHRFPVSFIGIGNMGLGMAMRLQQQGWPVHVHDIATTQTRQAQALGMQVFESAAALAAAMPPQGLLIVAVVNAEQCKEVIWGAQGAIAALQAGQTVMWCPTIGPHDVQALAAQLAEQGIHSIDAPMSGGPARAQAGTMSLMVAGADAVVEAHAQVLSALAQPVFRLGERIGDGARTKLVNNLLAGINLVGAAEALALAAQLGLDLQQTLAVIERSSGQSWIGSDRMRRAIADDFAPRAHMSLLTKDTRLALEAAAQVGFTGPLGAATQATFQAACAAYADADDGALLPFLRNSALPRTNSH
jgi:3-hydroxyisobutyrate dehydrogenase-like beta-hydroxyacid dehydrogenase